MMPLTFAAIGAEKNIVRITGKPEVKKHLENLGFVAGANTKILNAIGGNIIVDIKGSRIAISEEMARKILI